MKVHNELGNGFQEVIYQRCLEIEMNKTGLIFGREVDQEIIYNGNFVGTRRADFIVDTNVMVEIKAVITLDDIHLAQAKNYLKAYNLQTGLLINFGSPSMEFKKIFY